MKRCHRLAMTRRTLAGLAMMSTRLSLGSIEERSEEEGVGPVPVVSGGYRDGGNTL